MFWLKTWQAGTNGTAHGGPGQRPADREAPPPHAAQMKKEVGGVSPPPSRSRVELFGRVRFVTIPGLFAAHLGPDLTFLGSLRNSVPMITDLSATVDHVRQP